MRILIDGQTLSTPEIYRGIGMVFKKICEELVVNDFSKEWFISIRDYSDLRHFSPILSSRLYPIIIGESLPGENYQKQSEHYSKVLNEVVNKFKIDAYWIPNPLMMNIVFPSSLQNIYTLATVYDLIPLLMPSDYLHKWPEPLQIEYQQRVNSLPTWADRLIFISESARSDFEKLDRVACKSSVIHLAVDHTKFWRSLLPKDQSKNPYVLYTGGFDPRKNMEKALEAFSRLVNNFPKFQQLKFCVVCTYDSEMKAQYEQLATHLGVSDRLVMTGYVDDIRLAELYREASVFFFPSRYEGFGLPLLEAMACGLPIVTTKVASIPEVVGDLAYYCSTDDVEDMACALRDALLEGVIDENRKCNSVLRAQEFTWRKSAARYAKLFTEVLIGEQQSGDLQRPRIAFVSPWPPQRSGIANYSFKLVQHLKEYLEITLYLDDVEACQGNFLGLPARKLALLPQELEEFDQVIYHIGNNTSFHKEIYKLAWLHPGIIVIHDFNIHPFLADAFLNTVDESFYKSALIEGYGEKGANSYQLIKSDGMNPDIWNFPMSHALAKRSNATIVHSRAVKTQLPEIENLFVIPLGSPNDRSSKKADCSADKLRKKLGIIPNTYLIATFGFVNSNKRIEIILESINILVKRGYPVQFLIGGEVLHSRQELESKIKLLGLSSRVIISGYLNDEEFDCCIGLSDLVINLRYPSMGESSAALMEALSYGKPCIVSNYQQFAEFPDSVCWKVDIGELEIPQLVAYLEELMRNPAARNQLANNAAFFAANYSSYETAAQLYAYAIKKVLKSKPCRSRLAGSANAYGFATLALSPSFSSVTEKG